MIPERPGCPEKTADKISFYMRTAKFKAAGWSGTVFGGGQI
jgi:hypothetical protein